jgi:sugar lactone lactonase YvrE
VITGVHPDWAVPGGRVLVDADAVPLGGGPPRVRVGHEFAHVVAASSKHVRIVVPSGLEGGREDIVIDGMSDGGPGLQVGRTLATGLHQVDSPAFDGLGRLYVTHSGGRGVKVPVPIYRVSRQGAREPVSVELANPTSLALGPDGAMYVSSRFEGAVYRLLADDRVEMYASDLGVPTGLAFGPDGTLYVGDRSGSIFRVSPGREVDVFATLPASVAAFHLAFGPDGCLYVAAPTLASRDGIYRITPDRLIDTVIEGFGRPQGLAFDRRGDLYVAEALAGGPGLYRCDLTHRDRAPELVAAVPGIIGVAFDPDGGTIVASNETVWRFDDERRPN